MPVIALLTDFGTSDWFTAEIKAVIYNILPNAAVIDITHDINPGDIVCAAFILKASFKSFPKGTIFCTPVDPDTSGSTIPVAIQTSEYFFVGPDNGSASWAIENESIKSIVKISDIRYFRDPFSMTFRGRDIFAPVCAHLANGLPINALGPALSSYKHIPFPEPDFDHNTFFGTVLYVDHFGNVITNISSRSLSGDFTRVKIKSPEINTVLPFATSYSSVIKGEGLVYPGSTGLVEIGVNSGNAAKVYRLQYNEKIELTFF